MLSGERKRGAMDIFFFQLSGGFKTFPTKIWILLSNEILTPPCFRERVRRAMDFVLRQGKILPVEGVCIAVLDRHRAIF